LKILRTAGAPHSLRCEGPHQLPQKRLKAFVSILQSLAVAEIVNMSPSFGQFFAEQAETSLGALDETHTES
jgi:hypothetical protein